MNDQKQNAEVDMRTFGIKLRALYSSRVQQYPSSLFVPFRELSNSLLLFRFNLNTKSLFAHWPFLKIFSEEIFTSNRVRSQQLSYTFNKYSVRAITFTTHCTESLQTVICYKLIMSSCHLKIPGIECVQNKYLLQTVQ